MSWIYSVDGLVRVHHKNFTGKDAPCEGCDYMLNQILDWTRPTPLIDEKENKKHLK